MHYCSKVCPYSLMVYTRDIERMDVRIQSYSLHTSHQTYTLGITHETTQLCCSILHFSLQWPLYQNTIPLSDTENLLLKAIYCTIPLCMLPLFTNTVIMVRLFNMLVQIGQSFCCNKYNHMYTTLPTFHFFAHWSIPMLTCISSHL